MLLPNFEFHDPSRLGEACEILQHHGKAARPLAGGTDLLVNMKKKILQPAHLVSLGRIEELQQIQVNGDMLELGAGVTVADLAESARIREHLPALASGARALGTPLIRNLATLGGNIGSARPAADLLPALIVYDAVVTLASNTGERSVPVEEFFTGPGMTIIRENELIASIRLPLPRPASGAGYINLGVRKSQDCNLVNVAAYLELGEQGQHIQTARIALGSVGPTPLRAFKAEKLLRGAELTTDLFIKAGQAAREESQPILDFRGSAEYRRAMVGVLTKRTLQIALEKARR